jgi:hypothetical protein
MECRDRNHDTKCSIAYIKSVSNQTLIESGNVPSLALQNDKGTSLQSFIVVTNAAGNKGFALSLDEAGTNTNTFSINDEARQLTPVFSSTPMEMWVSARRRLQRRFT